MNCKRGFVMKVYVKTATIILTMLCLLLITANVTFAYNDCEHKYVLDNLNNYYATFKCDKCNETETGSIPSNAWVYNVYSMDDDWVYYDYEIPSEFTPGDTVSIYVDTYYSYDYPEIEITASDTNIVNITEVEHLYYNNIFSLEFLTEGSVTVYVTSKYDNSIVYETLTFKSKCEHNFVVKNASNYYITLECDKCNETKTGSVPTDISIYNVYSMDDDWIYYDYEIPSEFTPGETITIYTYSYDYCDYPEVELTASDNSIVEISKVEHHNYNNLYAFKFLKEGPVTITISSKYDSSIIYETLSFKTRCEHNFVAKEIVDYTVTFECSECNEIKSGSIPSYVWLNEVDQYDDSGISYSSYISQSFTKGQQITIYADKSYAEYSEIEFLTTNTDVIKIESIAHPYYDLYSFNFLKEGIATVVVTSKYDSNVVYDVLTFISDGYDSYLADNYLHYTGTKDVSGDIDGNGSITASDARLILRVAVELSNCSLTTKQYADADGNGKITSADARLVLRVATSLDNESILSEFYTLDPEYYNSYDYNNTLTISLDVGKKYSTDTYIIRDANNVTYTSSNTAVVTIDSSNNIKAVKKGYACVTVTNGKETFTYEVFVLAPNDTLDNYIYGDQTINLGIDDTISIEYVILKDTKNLKWSSSNPSVATVDNTGKIKALKKGYACIIASNGSESCYYDVNVKNELQEKIDLYREKYPDGYYWNNHTPSKTYPNVSEQPCTDHKAKKYEYCKGQCAGFADLMFKEVYGSNAKKHYGVTWDTIEIGDYIRLNPHHSIFITDVVKKGDIIGYDKWSGENITAYESYVVVVHCNWGSCCNIAWDDVFYKDSYSINSSASYSAQ